MRRKDEPRTHLERDEPAPGRASEAAPASELLALQRSIGNRAVGAMLARDATKTPPKPKEPTTAGNFVIYPGIGTIRLESFQFGAMQRQPPAGRDGSREAPDKDKDKGEMPGGEIVVTSKQGEHSNQIMRESLSGTPKDVEIVMAGEHGTMRLKLKATLVSRYTLSDGGAGDAMESWTLNFESMRHEVEEKQP
jgi:hypothetical protein